MKSKLLQLSVALVGLTFLAACEDPIIGKWESKDSNACGEKTEFEVDDELKAEGDLWVEIPSEGRCLMFEFDAEMTDEDDGKYEADIELNDGTDGKADCEMNDDEDEMDCDMELGGIDFGEETFEKQD